MSCRPQRRIGGRATSGTVRAVGHPLLTDDQASADALADRLLDTAVVRAALDVARERLRADELAQLPGMAARVDDYLAGLARNNALTTAGLDPFRPRLVWMANLDTKAGLDNPDTIYRLMSIDPGVRYRLRGRRADAAHVTFSVIDARPGDDAPGATLSLLDDGDLLVDDDGTFELTLGGHDRGPNHLPLPQGSVALLVRDTFSDWNQTATTLRAERVDRRAPPPAPRLDELAHELARFVGVTSRFWLEYPRALLALDDWLGPQPARDGLPGQYNVFGNYDVADGRAVVVTVGDSDAAYFSIGSGSPFFTSNDHLDRAGHFHAAQSVPDGDGRYTYVIAAHDPGVHNWIDVGDVTRGLVFIRWQGLPTTGFDPAARPSVDRCTVTEVRDRYPDLAPATPQERERARRRRRASYLSRTDGRRSTRT